MHYLRNMFNKVKNWFRRRTFFVICDPADNSVTFSKALFKHLNVMGQEKAQVFVFKCVPYTREHEYGFVINPEFDVETQLADIQYNSQHRCIGFETLNPTVNRIFYDYGLPHEGRVKLSVKVRKINNLTYYLICRPKDDKHTRKYTQG